VSESSSPPPSPVATPPSSPSDGGVRRALSLGVDWWAVIVAGVVVVLALADVLPKIPW
jgi:hypothetical protein